MGVGLRSVLKVMFIVILLGSAFPPANDNRCSLACQLGRAKVAVLVAEFERNKAHYTSRAFSEADVRKHFIDGFFEALGWDVNNSSGYQLFRQDTVPETRLWKNAAVHYADYGFRINGRAVFYVEAEAASRDVDHPDFIAQAVGYAWSSTHANLAVLTDFEELRVFDARSNPHASKPHDNEVMELRLNYDAYVEQWPTLWNALSKEAVAGGSLDRLLAGLDPKLVRDSVNQAFLKDLDSFRLKLGQALHDNNPTLDADRLNEATHHILNQIVFGRVLEDRDIEPTGRLREAVDVWRARGGDDPLWSFLRAEFGRLERRYNGVIFAAHFSDKLIIPNDVLAEIVDALYPPTSPYAFSIIPIDVLGRAYESYLGKRLEIEDGTVKLAPKPEVRRAGGVFYTPNWIVDYILDQTLSPKLKGKSVADISKLRVLDPACGAGAFSVQMASRILNAALRYYAKNKDQIGGIGTEFPDAYTLYDGTLKLSVTKKAELIEQTIFCVDVDPQAVEITRMWLYVLILEGESSPIVTQERRYKIPNRIWPPRIRDFKLPNLAGNIVNGNSLVGTDFSDDIAEQKRGRAFDWHAGEGAIAQIIRAGGFDVVAGNPPYLSIEDARRFIPAQYQYMRDVYASMKRGRADMSYAFIEKGISLLKPDGRLGYITSNSFIWNKAGGPMRKIIGQSRSLRELIDLGVAPIFEDASPATAIVILDKAPHRKFRHARLFFSDFKLRELLTKLPLLEFQTFPISRFNEKKWALPALSDRGIFEDMQKHPLRLGDIAKTFAGVITGADKVFIVEALQERGKYTKVRPKNSEETYWVETKILKPFLRGRHIRRYQPFRSKEKIICTCTREGKPISETEMNRSFAKALTYFSVHKHDLFLRKSSRSEARPWYSLARLSNNEEIRRPKLLTGWKAGKAQFTLDADGRWFFQGSSRLAAVIPTNNEFTLEMLLGLLNSESMMVYARTMRPELWGGIPFSSSFLKTIPIVAMTKKSRPLYERIGAKAAKILELNRTSGNARRVTTLERQIDELVVKLYALDPNDKVSN